MFSAWACFYSDSMQWLECCCLYIHKMEKAFKNPSKHVWIFKIRKFPSLCIFIAFHNHVFIICKNLECFNFTLKLSFKKIFSKGQILMVTYMKLIFEDFIHESTAFISFTSYSPLPWLLLTPTMSLTHKPISSLWPLLYIFL